nr:MAG TPA: Rad50 zinc hook motif [Caudoviricetes sp.]
MWNYECPICGANLDPGEKCDCQDERQRYLRQFRVTKNGQYKFNLIYEQNKKLLEKLA